MASPEIETLTQALARLPGLGPRSARRAVLHLLKKRETALAPLLTLKAGALTVTVWLEAPTTVYRAGVVAPEQLRSPATVPQVVMVPVVFIVTLSPVKVVPLSTMMPKSRFWADERTSGR